MTETTVADRLRDDDAAAHTTSSAPVQPVALAPTLGSCLDDTSRDFKLTIYVTGARQVTHLFHQQSYVVVVVLVVIHKPCLAF